ncbi:MAG: hypothetical protein LUQ65_03275 [Candidatus Helarchaeota archaeon]|nr:hypothetical protein [Candidatus Helarchaeota archaeon]
MVRNSQQEEPTKTKESEKPKEQRRKKNVKPDTDPFYDPRKEKRERDKPI